MHRIKLLLLLVVALTNHQLKGQLLINEMVAVNDSGLSNPISGEPGDWIEIYNGTGESVDLADYYLSDKLTDPSKWKFPAGTQLPSGAFQLVWADGTNSSTACHTNFKLSASGETVYLFEKSGTLYDSLRFPRMQADISYGISQDGSRLYFKYPTPGEFNDSGSGFLYSAGVSITPPAAIYSNSVEVVVEAGAPGTVRYTLDGSDPDSLDLIYSEPIQVSQNSVVRARLWQEGFEQGPISTSSFLIGNGFTMPVFSLTTDPLNFWDDEKGIYVVGTNGIPGNCTDVPVNWNQDWERPLSFEYFDLTGKRMIQQDVGVKMHGACSRTAPMKSLALFARGRYGNSSMDFPFFSDKPEIDAYKGLILRNSGSDNQYTLFRDAMIQSVVWPKMDVDYQAYETARVFLNGEFFGIYNLREKTNEHWVASNYGLDPGEIDFIKIGVEGMAEVFAGSIDAYDSLQHFLENNSLAVQSNYDWVADRVEIDSYMDYLITELFFAHRDWPGNNQKLWKAQAPGSKWRWILFDLDYTMGLYDFNPALDMFSFATADYTDDWPNPRWATLIIRRLLENEGFREEFIQKYLMHLNTTLNTDRVHHQIDSFYYHLMDVVPDQIERWNRPWSMEGWEEYVNELRTFASERPAFVRTNMRNFFQMGREISLEVAPTDGTYRVKLNDVQVASDGMLGHYLAGTELNLNCITEPGYRFSHWEVIAGNTEVSVLVPPLSTWKYNDSGLDPDTQWKEEDYDDSAWSEGAGELGYGDGGETTILDFGVNSEQKHISYYFRLKFDIADPEQFQELALQMIRDDGVVAYLNGTEVLRNNMPAGEILPSTLATSFVDEAQENSYMSFSADAEYLLAGTNILAVEIHQYSPTSSDLSFDLELQGLRPNPDTLASYEDRLLTLTPDNRISIRALTTVHQPETEAKLYINEFMASNQGSFTDPSGGDSDWIEIYNDGEQMDLAGLYLTDDRDAPTLWQIPFDYPEQTTIGAHSFLIFYADQKPDFGPLHTNFKLSRAGEFVGLSTQSAERLYWIDSREFGIQESNISFGRYPDGSSNWMPMTNYTPGASNQLSLAVKQDEMELAMQLDLFPNPVSNRLNIRLTCSQASDPQAEISLYDLSGRQCLQSTANRWSQGYAGSVDVSGLPAGIYLLVVEHGRERISSKIIKTED